MAKDLYSTEATAAPRDAQCVQSQLNDLRAENDSLNSQVKWLTNCVWKFAEALGVELPPSSEPEYRTIRPIV